MIKKIASNYIYCGLLTTAFGITAAGLRGEIYTRQILNRIKEKPTEILEPILLWPKYGIKWENPYIMTNLKRTEA